MKLSSIQEEKNHYSGEYEKVRKMEDSMRDKLLMAETENASMKAKIEGLLREIENK